MSDVITIHVPIQLEHYGEQLWRARPLGPWKLQVVGADWSQLKPALVRRLSKLLPETLPTDLYAGGLPAECQHWRTQVQLKPENRDTQWLEPIVIELDCFRWQLSSGNCMVRVPAVNCTLFGKPDELSDSIVSEHARVALIRTAENQHLSTLAQRFSKRTFAMKSLPIELPIGGQPEKRERQKSELKKTATLRSTASDLTKAKLQTVYGLDDKVAELADHFQGDSPQSVLLVGPAGVGKTSLVYRLVALRQQFGLENRIIWSTSGARIVSGMSGLGMWQQRCSKLIRQAHASKAILHLGSLFELMEAGKIDGQPGVASMVRQSIARGNLLAIAECTAEQLAIIERDDPMLLRAFTRLQLQEQAEPRIREILRAASKADVSEHSISFSDQAIEELVRLHRRFATYSAMPATPLRLMQSISDAAAPGSTIEADAVARAFAKQTGLPGFLVDDSIPLDLQRTLRELSSQVMGQSEPLELIVDLMATLKARLTRPGRPLASLMFIGPTGVGKTEMAKALAKLLYSDTSRLIRIDMSEYASPWSAVKLIGKPGEGDGRLTSPIREQPFSVVLLDEFEKADPNVFDILLQMLGEGRLTDSQGRLADFRNAVVIMTSNLGAETFREGNFGFGDADVANWREHFQREVRKFVRPEFLGRIDRIVPFQPLPKEIVKQIARREIERIRQRPGLKYTHTSLELSQSAIDLLSELGYEPKYGARPLRRAIEQNVTVPLADALSQANADSTWNFEVDVDRDQRICIRSHKKSTKTKSVKEVEAEVINAWQQLGIMARTARHCAPVRDLENEIERTQRQNELLEKRINQASGPRRLAVYREQIQQGLAFVETGRRIHARLLEVVDQITRQHLALLVAWHGNQSIPWNTWRSSANDMLTLLRSATEDVLKRRLVTSPIVSLLVTGRNASHLEVLWKSYRQLAIENRWGWESFLVQEYDPRKDETSPHYRKLVSERKAPVELPTEVLQPSLRLAALEDAVQETRLALADLYRHPDSERLMDQSPHAIGFALQLTGSGVESWLEEEGGIVHFFDSGQTGAKRRQRYRVHVFPHQIAKVKLPSNWLEPIPANNERDPRRVIDLASQVVTNDDNILVSYSQGKLSEAIVQVMRQEHEHALWKAIGFRPVPSEARLGDLDFDVPF